MLFDIFLLLLAFALITKGGDMFVDSSVQIATAVRIPRIVIGGTLVSLATTLPELVVSATASALGDPGIALGNAVGSAIVDMGLVIGTVALLSPVSVDRTRFQNRVWWVRIAGVLVVLFSWNLEIGRVSALVLIALAGAYLYTDYRSIRNRLADVESSIDDERNNVRVGRGVALRFALGAALIIGGSRLLLASGTALATDLGVPSVLIGLSVIAIGTSLPELVTGVASARKGVPDLSVGNVLGANVMNLALVIGVSGAIQPLSLSPFTQWYTYPWLFVFIVAIGVTLGRTGTIGRRGGLIFLLLYTVYAAGLVLYGAVGGA